MIARLLILSILAPAVVTGAIAAVARLLPQGAWLRRAMALPALAAGYAAGHLVVAGAPSFPPVDTTQGLFYLALAAGVLGVAETRPGAPWSGGVARALAIGLTLGLALHPLVRNQWTTRQAVIRLAILSVVALGLWWAIRAAMARLPAGAAWLAWITIFAGGAALLLLARTALLAQLASMIAVALIALALAQRGSSAAAATAAVLPFVIAMLLAFVLNGFFYAELGTVPAVALAASPLAAVAAATFAGRRGPRAQAAAAVLGVALLLTPLIAHAAISYAADDRGYDDYLE